MAVLAVFVVFLLHQAYHTTCDEVDPTPEIYEPSWMYKCEQEGCQRVQRPREHENELFMNHYESLNLCRMLCGYNNYRGLWPRPRNTPTIGMQTQRIHPKNIRYDINDTPPDTKKLLSKMIKVTTKNVLAECAGNVTEEENFNYPLVVVAITVSSPWTNFTLDVDEKYDILIRSMTKGESSVINVKISASTVYGARHGLETFSQLTVSDKDQYADKDACYLYMVTSARISDKPVYRYRGLLLDSARNFLSLNSIKKTIDGMAASKMNVLHWHVTDSQSFPLESRSIPFFTRYGAYSPDKIYTVEDVRELVEYAQVRGVRIMIEIDAPAHAGNGWQWGPEQGLGELAVCVNEQPWRGTCVQPPCGQLNPINPKMYDVLEKLYRDIVDLIPPPALFHMGGDETAHFMVFIGHDHKACYRYKIQENFEFIETKVYGDCWIKHPEISSYMTSNSMNWYDLWVEFHKKALQKWDDVVREAGLKGEQRVMIWSSAITAKDKITRYLDKDRYIIQVWSNLDSPNLNDLIQLGYHVVSVPRNIWYLDHGFWGSTSYSNWRRMYAHRLPTAPNVMGGEVAMWGEYVDDNVLETRVWPRAAAVAERLWSNPDSTANEAESRLQRHRDRLIARGIKVDAMAPAWCSQHSEKCL